MTAGRPLQFPQDYGSHPAFRNEWWYVTGWVDDASGNAAGFQVTFFRNRPRVAEDNPSRFAPRQLLFAHAALADPRYGRLRHDQRAARAGFDIAAAHEGTTDVWIGDWSLRQSEGSYRARIAARDFRLDLQFAPTQAVLLQGDAGFSRKGPSPHQASYYYSQPQLAVTGQVATAGSDEKLAVAKRQGADETINYSKESVKDRTKALTNDRGADVIFDPVGGDVFDDSLRCIAPEGRLLVIGFASGRIPSAPANLVLLKNFSIVGIFWGGFASREPHRNRANFEALFRWFEAGKLKPPVSKVFPLDQVPQAMNMLLSRQATGKLIISVR